MSVRTTAYCDERKVHSNSFEGARAHVYIASSGEGYDPLTACGIRGMFCSEELVVIILNIVIICSTLLRGGERVLVVAQQTDAIQAESRLSICGQTSRFLSSHDKRRRRQRIS